MTTIKIKSAVEQLQEQYPELYNEIYLLGFNDAKALTPSKNDDRFYMVCKSLDAVQAVVNDLHADGYKSISEYFSINTVENDKVIYVSYNTTTKEFAIDTSLEYMNLFHSLQDAEYALYIKI